jgi:hypothetical protein
LSPQVLKVKIESSSWSEALTSVAVAASPMVKAENEFSISSTPSIWKLAYSWKLNSQFRIMIRR